MMLPILGRNNYLIYLLTEVMILFLLDCNSYLIY